MGDLLKDKICIVTGASHGIGKGIVNDFLDEGAIVYGCARTLDSMKEIMAANPRFTALYFDVTDVVEAKKAIMQIKKEQGRIDVLVNNAGIVYNRKIGMISREETEAMFRTNVFAIIDLTQLVSRIMARNGKGAIVNISSVTAVLGSAGQSAYSATKGAIISFTRSAAKELAPLGIRVNAVAPGIVKTERFEELYEVSGDKIDSRIQKISLNRLGTPKDIAYACTFLVSDKSSYISGQILGVDGCASI